MSTCREENSSVPFHSNYWENCEYDSGYEASYRFNKEQYYEGEFFRDSIHGEGTYKWKDVAVYEGGFYTNFKEGYASLSLPDNSYFEGLFIRNEPFGPGILTHANGRQDAGFWMGRKLVRLSRAVDFIIPRLAPTSAAKIKLLQFRRLIPLSEVNWGLSSELLKKCGYPFQHFYSPYSSLIYDPRSLFFDSPAFEKTYFVNFKEVLEEFPGRRQNYENLVDTGDYVEEEEEEEEEEQKLNSIKENTIPSQCLCSQNVFVMQDKNENTVDICDSESVQGEHEMGILRNLTKYGTIDGYERDLSEIDEEIEEEENISVLDENEESKVKKSRPSNIVSWNRSELCTEMLKQIFRYRAFEDKLTFNLGKLMLGLRTAFRRTGVKEKQCLHFLKMCSIGPAHIVKDLLCTYEISEELMDARGNNSLMFAAATDQHEIIDILLDFGVDVNTFNDENLTPLNLCLLRRLAYTKGISNWETAFLPKEIDVPPSDYPQPQELEAQVSILSLDRIFGDGMSLNDSKSRIFESRYLTPFASPIMFKEGNDVNQAQNNRNSDESRDLSEVSQITILNINKSPGSHILMAHNDEPHTHFNPRRSFSASALLQTKDASQPLGSNEETPRININMVPKSNKRDEFVRSIIKSNKDKYLFEFTFEKNPKMVGSIKVETSGKRSRKESKPLREENIELEKNEEAKSVEEIVDFELSKKIAEIDKTIQKLLRRGADPNMSEVPKPAIHLGVFAKDLNTVYNLLLYGANPNSQLYSNEGLLTPLHIVVLLPSCRVLVDICELLLNFGADPNKETFPMYSVCEEEKDYLDSHQGRNPLQLLCMRPDLEYADAEDNLIKIALLLAANTDRRCFYNGHSCLTLAMLFSNKKLLKALLDSKLFDPNEVLEKDRGTALHVLVSTEMQKKTAFEDSINMCDILIAAGANPLKKFKHPESLRGTCVDYGYREIETEKEARKHAATVKKDAKKSDKPGKEKSSVRDYLQDHEKVVEYLGNIASVLSGKKKTGRRKQRSSSQDSLTKTGQGVSGKGGRAGGNGKGRKKGEEDEGEGQKKGAEGEGEGKDKTKDDQKGGLADSKGKQGVDDETDLKGKKRKAGDEEAQEEKLGKKNKISFDADGEKKGQKKKGKGKDLVSDLKKGDGIRGSEKSTEKGFKKDLMKPREKLSKASCGNSSLKQLGARSETFPEKLRQNLLQMYGNCGNIDVNEFLVPYVVLRDGELYYRFQGRTPFQKEQYSLI